ncbi:MAG: SIS domain-containing protein [Succinivibrionaceae bacterium]
MFDIKTYVADSISVKQKILANPEIIDKIQTVSKYMIDTFVDGCKVLVAGNGGSAADAQHFAAELVSRFYFDRPGLPAIALTTDTSIMTAIGNDYDFSRVFARQVEALGSVGDLFIGISTSGNSKNVIEAIEVAKSKNIFTVGLVGEKPSKMDDICDLVIKVPSVNTPNIQESQLMIEHIICAIVEDALFGNQKK